ncbi:MAG TPA: hypothetical protein V6D08_06535 [Candidatus Obscuribacterales bacterium]
MTEETADKAQAGAASRAKKPRGHKLAAILSCLLWAAGFFLAFVVPAGSPSIWVPDTLLLLGFIPLLLVWKPVWPWFAFGIFNIFIGFVLLVAQFLPESSLVGDLPKVRKHLAELHVWLVWVAFGAAAIFYGALRLLQSGVRWLMSRTGRR